MPRLHPFAAFIPDPDKASAVAVPPYDVLSPEAAAAYAENNPLSFARVSRAEIEFDAGVDPYADRVYTRAKVNLNQLIRRVPYAQDPEPHIYVYGMSGSDFKQLGLVGAAAVDDYDWGRIKQHEATRPDKEFDRARHIMETRAHTGMVLLTMPTDDAVERALREAADGVPVLALEHDGVTHSVWRLAPDRTAKVLELLDSIPAFYIADGHHRAAAASRVREALREDNPRHTGDEPYNRFPVVIVPAGQVRVLAYNRLLRDLGGLSLTGFLEVVDQYFLINRSTDPVPAGAGRIHLYLRWQWYELVPREPAAGLPDTQILQERLLAPILGIEDPRTDPRLTFVGGDYPAAELAAAVDAEEWAAAVSFFPTPVDQLIAVADASGRMPPKSTWFAPKVLDGLIVHRF